MPICKPFSNRHQPAYKKWVNQEASDNEGQPRPRIGTIDAFRKRGLITTRMGSPHRLHRFVIPDLCKGILPKTSDWRSLIQNARSCVHITIRFNVNGTVPESGACIAPLCSVCDFIFPDTLDGDYILFDAYGVHTRHAAPHPVEILNLRHRLFETDHLQRDHCSCPGLLLSFEEVPDICDGRVEGVHAMNGGVNIAGYSVQGENDVIQAGIENRFDDFGRHQCGVCRKDHSDSLGSGVANHSKGVRIHDGFAGTIKGDVTEISCPLVDQSPEEGEIDVRSIKCHGLADTHPAEMIAGMGVRDHQRWRKARANRRSRQISGQQPKPLYGRLCAERHRRDHRNGRCPKIMSSVSSRRGRNIRCSRRIAHPEEVSCGTAGSARCSTVLEVAAGGCCLRSS
jgi:hypothetical protein